MTYRFGNHVLDPQGFELTENGEPVPLEPQVFSLIVLLIENRDRVVTKDELIEVIWNGRIVSEATLSSRISAARRALGDTGSQQSVIRTIPRRGFRFVADVEADIPGPRASARETPAQSQDVRFCVTPDGIEIPYARSGSGPTLVKVANWLNHLEQDWSSPMWAPLFRELAGIRSLLRYDSRGVGMSNWNVPEITYDSFLTDIETVIAAAEREPFALLGISQSAAIAIDYAARHPERVTHLILWGGFARGRRQRGNPENLAESEAFITLMQQGWGRENSPFRDMFASLYLPDATDEQIGWWSRMQRTATSAENAVRMREAIDNIDVGASLPHIRVPTLIMHSQGDLVAPVSEAHYMAARIPDAQFVLLESTNHMVMSQEAAWQRAVRELHAFLAEG